MLERFGVFSTESNGHLSEYLPGIENDLKKSTQWIDLSDWIHGETGVTYEFVQSVVIGLRTTFPRWLQDQAGLPMEQYERSTEHCNYIIEAQETGRVYEDTSTQKQWCNQNLPDDCIAESTGFVDRFGLHMASGIELPMGCAAACRTSIDVQRMSVEAAMKGDVDLLKLAVLHDPLVELFVHQKKYGPWSDRNVDRSSSMAPTNTPRQLNQTLDKETFKEGQDAKWSEQPARRFARSPS